MAKASDKRQRRSDNPTMALFYQLDTCLKDAGLEAIVLSDEDGLCLASSGDPDTCEEIAANLPFVGTKVSDFEGVLFAPAKAWKVTVKRFEVEGTELYLCAAGGKGDARSSEISRSLSGARRILAA